MERKRPDTLIHLLRIANIEEMLRKALRKAEMEADYEAMANDPESQADAEFYKDFCGDIEWIEVMFI